MIAYHPIFVHPLPEGHRFPMIKYELIYEQLLYQGIVDSSMFFSPEAIDDCFVFATHDEAYWKRALDLTLSPAEVRRIGFPLSKELIEREQRIAEGTRRAAIYALNSGCAFNIAGGTHHAGYDWGEGFCLLNDQAIAATYLLNEEKVSKILIIDLDVHQGNGTANIFENNDRVYTFSMHCERNFPFRKEQSDLDIGLPDGVTDDYYLKQLEVILEQLFEEVKPAFVFYLSGVDVLATDKLGKLKLTMEACKKRDQLVFKYCKKLAIPVQISMGGGYSTDIRHIVDAHCQTFKAAVGLSLL